MGLQSSIKYDVKALKPFTLGKMYSMALTFDTKNVELAREKKFLFHVSRRDHSSGKKNKKWKKSQKFPRAEGEGHTRHSNTLNYKDQAKHRKKTLCYNRHELEHLAKEWLQPVGKCPKQSAALAMEVKTPVLRRVNK